MLSLFAKNGEYCKGEPDDEEADPKVYSNNLIKHEGLEPHMKSNNGDIKTVIK